MRTHQRYVPTVILVILLLLLTSCSAPSLASSSLSPAQMLQKSINAMSHLQSAHLDLQTDVSLPSDSLMMNATINTSALRVTGHGDVANPDKVSLDLFMGNTPLVAVRSLGSKVYIQEKNGKWFFLEKSQIKDKEQSFFAQSMTQHLGQIMAVLQNAKLTDDGQETLNGQSLEHITATLDGQALQALSTQFNGFLAAHMPQAQNQLQQATLDLWLDQSTWYVHQAQLDLVAQVRTPLAGSHNTNSAITEQVDLKVLLNLSKLNQPVTIQTPANAVALP